MTTPSLSFTFSAFLKLCRKRKWGFKTLSTEQSSVSHTLQLCSPGWEAEQAHPIAEGGRQMRAVSLRTYFLLEYLLYRFCPPCLGASKATHPSSCPDIPCTWGQHKPQPAVKLQTREKENFPQREFVTQHPSAPASTGYSGSFCICTQKLNCSARKGHKLLSHHQNVWPGEFQYHIHTLHCGCKNTLPKQALPKPTMFPCKYDYPDFN